MTIEVRIIRKTQRPFNYRKMIPFENPLLGTAVRLLFPEKVSSMDQVFLSLLSMNRSVAA